MKVIVRRNWENASNAWVDVQTYTKLKLPPAGMQYKISFFDKFGTPAQMIVTSTGASWVDGLGGGYKGKTVLDATVEQPQVSGGDGVVGSSGLFDGVELVSGGVGQNGERIFALNLFLGEEEVEIGTEFAFIGWATDFDEQLSLTSALPPDTVGMDAIYDLQLVTFDPLSSLYLFKGYYTPQWCKISLKAMTESLDVVFVILLPSGKLWFSDVISLSFGTGGATD